MPGTRAPRRRQRVAGSPSGKMGAIVAERRIALGMTQGELADLADIGIMAVHKIEHGKSVASSSVLAVLEALGLGMQIAAKAELADVPGRAL